MRLIDAAALKKALGDWNRDNWTDAFTGADAGSDFADIIDHAKTIDSAPVVHAHWIRTAIDDGNKGYIRCSNCGADFSLPVHKMQGFYQRYCGSCGAKMDEPDTGGKQQNDMTTH